LPKTLARRIKAARKAAGLTQEALAETCQVSRSAASQWEKEGGTAPSIERVGTIAEFLGVSLDWLVLGRGTPGQHLQRSAESSFQREVFAAGLRWARQMHRLSTQDLARIIPVSHARYLSLEAQKADPTLAELATLARHFDGIPLEFFVLGQTPARGRDEAGSLPRAAIHGSGGAISRHRNKAARKVDRISAKRRTWSP
jgi:transcriptional regulator with XRE-family HTH domain